MAFRTQRSFTNGAHKGAGVISAFFFEGVCAVEGTFLYFSRVGQGTQNFWKKIRLKTSNEVKFPKEVSTTRRTKKSLTGGGHF